MAWLYYLDLIGQRPEYVPDKYHKSIYFETFRYHGDFINSIICILQRHIKFWPYLFSYLRLFEPGVQKVIEPVRLDDMGFTWLSVKDNFISFAKWLKRYLQRKIY